MLNLDDIKSYGLVAYPVVRQMLVPTSVFVVSSFVPSYNGVFWGFLLAVVGCYLIYRYMWSVQETIEEMPYGPSQIIISFPFCVFCLLWMNLLVIAGRMDGITFVVFGYVIVMCSAIWPVFWKSRKKPIRKRRLPYPVAVLLMTAVYVLSCIGGVLDVK